MVSQSKLEITRKLFYWLTISNFLYIIVLLILAGVTIATLMGENGLLNRAKTAAEENRKAEAIEDVKLRIMEVQTEKEGKATLEDLVEYLENNTTNEYKITKVSGGTASLVEGSIESSEVGNAEKIYITSVKYGYEIEVNSNMTVTERVVASSGSSSSGSGSGAGEGTSEELESLREEYENFRRAIAQSIEDAGGVETSYDADATTFDTNIKGILTEVTKNDTAENTEILSGETAHVNGAQVTGTMANKSDQTTSASTAEKSGSDILITIPSNGYYATNSKISIPTSTLNQYVGGSITSAGSRNTVSSISCSVGDYFLIHSVYELSNDLSGCQILATCVGPCASGTGIDSTGLLVRATSTRISCDYQFGYIKLQIQ